ncbi:hypothetical protein HMPREF1624_01453 [Sporothrix schenckii ATCC 58251]|uniref:Uncharacterized protein n=1 Tax=Sporothrix schenckii (strain ATCC 58251 / de Perez 2211183) TaxID=1391915 RepID=U7Q5N5_SPOS1|nr:hypothetical protein HMPREF1624_01453 [Sporothrix schenckii ATCC 58251]
MSLNGSTATQRQPAPRDSGHSYSSRQQQAKNQPDLSGRLVYADPRSLPSFPSVGVKLDSTNTAALTASKVKSPPAIFSNSGSVHSASLKAATQAAAAASAALVSAKPAGAKSPSAPDGRSRNVSQSQPTNADSTELTSPTLQGESTATASNVNTNTNTNMATKPSGKSSEGWGNSAANQAFRNSQILSAKRASAPPEKPIPEIAALGYQPSLRAAKGAMKQASHTDAKSTPGLASSAAATSLSGAASTAAGGSSAHSTSMRTRSRAQSTPLTLRQQKSMSSHFPDNTASYSLVSSPPDPKVSAANALSAATIAHSASAKSRGSASSRASYVGDGGSVPYTNLGRQMYTSHPPVGHETEDQRHADGLHASAVALAKKMYSPGVEGGVSGAGAGAGGSSVPNVQEQAYKLAQERLEKLHELHGKDREYRDHYMDPSLGASTGGETSRRLTMRGRLRRRRSSSDGDINSDHLRPQEIRNQMSLLSSRISDVEEKRRRDRQNVLLAAQRNVKSQLQDIDEQVYANSGRLPPSVMSKIEPKINSLAQERADAYISNYPRSDQVDVGGGKFINRTDVDRLATRRVQPVIDDMHEKAQAEHDRQAKLREKDEERKAEAAIIDARGKDMKAMYRQLKKDEKARKAEEKTAKRHSKILGIPIGFGLGTGAAAASTTGDNAGNRTDKASNVVNGKGKHCAKDDAAETARHGTGEEVMTAPDTSSAASDFHSNDVSSLSSPTSPVPRSAGTGTGIGVGAAATGAAVGAGSRATQPSVPTTTAAADITNSSSLATAPVTQPFSKAPAARDASSSAAPSAGAMATPATHETADRSDAPLEKSGSNTSRRLSRLFVKTPKDSNVEPTKPESSGNVPSKISGSAVAGTAAVVGAGGAVGAGVGSQTKSVAPGTTNGVSSGPASAAPAAPTTSSTAPGARVGTGVGAPISSASDKASTPKSPVSPLSDESASSPNSNSKVKSWLKSRFSRDPSKSSASASNEPAASTSGKAAATGTGVSTASTAGSAGPAPSKDLGSSAVGSDSQRPDTERTFIGGHTLNSSDNKDRVGSGSLTMPLIAGGTLVAAGGATAAGLASSKGDAPASGQGKETLGEQPGNSPNSVNQAYYTPTGSEGPSVTQPGDRAADLKEQGASGKSGLPDSKELTGITAPKDSYEKDAAALAPPQSGTDAASKGQYGSGFGKLGPLTPMTMGPAEGAKTTGTTGTSGSSGLAGTAGVVGTACAVGAIGTAGAAGVAASTNRSSNTAALNTPSADYTLPGNRTSYASSHYSNDAGVPGVAGSGFGLIGHNIFANYSGASPAAGKTKTSETAGTSGTAAATGNVGGANDKGNTFVSVPPPASDSGVNVAAFTPPRAITDPAEKSASPVRDSRFLENLEEYS